MFAGLRELPKYHLVEALGAVREQLAAVGAELAARRAASMRPDDIFFLDLAEAHRGARRAPRCRASWHSAGRRTRPELGRRHIPRVLLSDGTEPEAVQTAPAEGAGRPDGGAGPAPRPRPAPSRPGPA